jgi:hypothetical protein|nr:MAG TPA: hypothetical protein [Bacteriophage sp.]
MRIVSQSKDSSFSKQAEEVFIQMNQESTSTKIFFMPEK